MTTGDSETAKNIPDGAPLGMPGIPSYNPKAEPLPPGVSPSLSAAREEIRASIDADGNPTGDYWRVLGYYISRQTAAQESMRKMLVFFTVLTVIGLIAGLIIGIVGAVELSHALNPPTSTDPFGFSNP